MRSDRFDTPSTLPHPTEVPALLRRLVALAAILTLCVGNVVLCAGWQPTPEARMACCKNGASCPMQKSEHRSDAQRTMTQAQADDCCAASSNQTDSPSAVSTFMLANAAALPAIVAFVVPVAVPALQAWRAVVPLPTSPVPKHLLLAVFLI